MTRPTPLCKSSETEQQNNKQKKLSFAVTPGHDLLLRGLGILHRATAEQLTRLNYKPGMLTTVKARLKDLADNRYVLPLSHPSIRLPYVYALDRKGLNYLADQGVDIREYFRPSQEEDSAKNFLFREHMLAISDLLIHTLLFVKADPSYRVGTLLHERSFKNHPIKVTDARLGKEETKTIVPDAYLEFIHTNDAGEEAKLPVVWELDRGTEDQKFFRKRIRAYVVFIKSRAFRTVFGVENITIAFATTKDHNRIRQMIEWTRKELAATNEPSWLADLFLFTRLPENMAEIELRQLFLDPVWYVPPSDMNPVSLLGE